MKKCVVLLACLLAAGLAYGQAIDLSQVQLSDLDLTQADLSEAEIYFAGPVDLLITNVKYMGMSFMAVLRYDGQGVIEVVAPPADSTVGMPAALDFSEVEFTLVADGIQVTNLIADGYYFSGKLVPTPTLGLAIQPPLYLGGSAVPPDLSGDVARLQSQVAAMQRDLSAAQTARTQAENQVTTLQRDLTAAQTSLTTTQTSLTAAQTRVTSLEAQLRATPGVVVGPLEAAQAVTRPVASGWAGGSSLRGSWTLSAGTLRQAAAGEFFAKYAVPVRQDANELVYTFSGTGAAAGWSGFGLHFLASGSRNGTLYGYGSSYLVWVTRDPANTQSDRTYVQLYRSYDDVRMVQIASKEITGSIDRGVEIGVYVNRMQGTIAIGTLGAAPTLVIEYRDPAIIRSGSQVAARTLGPATVSDLNVLSK